MGLHHVGLVVEDLDRSARWYADVLGLERGFDFEIPDTSVRGCFVGRTDGVQIELFERAGSAPGPARPDPVAALAHRGYGHICLTSEDLEAEFARMVSAGARAVWEPRRSPQPGVRMAFLADPDGNLIELIEST